MKNKRSKNLSTNLNHPPKVEIKSGNTPLNSPIYQSAKFDIAQGTSYSEQFIYSRVSNPTLRELELTLAEAQGQEDCVVVSSGMAAISGVFLTLLKTGDHVISFRETYKPARIFIHDFLNKFGISSSILSLNNLASVKSAIVPGKTKIIYFESPSNPNLSIADITKLKVIAQKNNILLILDATFAGLHQHTDCGIDLFVHSLTKFANGHGDLIAGSISGSKKLITRIRFAITSLGATLDPHTAFLIQRGLKTYELRYQRQTETAQKVAEFLEAHPKVKKVYYPGLKSHPEYKLAKKQMSDMGAIVSFEIIPKVAKNAVEFCHRLNFFHFTVSVGSTESLINPTHTFFADDLSTKDKEEMGLNAYSLRLSIGLEHEDDLIEDLRKALDNA